MKVLLLTVMMIFATSASAGLYKWVDNEGNVHYSQKRPRDKQYKRLKAPAPTPQNTKLLYSTDDINNKQDVTESEMKKNEELRELNCTRAKKRLSIYQVYSRIRDKDGTIRNVSDEERSREIKKAQEAISDFCH